jgi:hypothetical protein
MPMTLCDTTRTTLRDRFLARLRARRLDRCMLASSLRRIARGDAVATGLTVRVPTSQLQVMGARIDLERLAARLADGRPVEERGVALTRELLADGAGPLYWYASSEDLGARVRHALTALEPGAAR